MTTEEEGWGFPTGSRKCHWFGPDGRALCGKWARFGMPLLPGGPGKPSPDDCSGCRKRLDKQVPKP